MNKKDCQVKIKNRWLDIQLSIDEIFNIKNSFEGYPARLQFFAIGNIKFNTNDIQALRGRGI